MPESMIHVAFDPLPAVLVGLASIVTGLVVEAAIAVQHRRSIAAASSCDGERRGVMAA
jgi:hypothetical protein